MTTYNHEEWTKENSLTSPEDRDIENKWKPDQSSPHLTSSEAQEAISVLDNKSFTDKFPRIDRTYADPAISMQHIGLISFVPAKGATPNENGIFGFAKLRGNYPTEMEASQRAEYLIRNVDSYHQIYHTYIGRPFPITSSSKFSAETSEIDIRKETAKTISQNVKDKKDEEQKIIQEIKEKEDRLIQESKREDVDPYEEYITTRVKKAQLIFTYLEHQKKMEEIKNILIKTRKTVSDMDEKYPEFKDSYYKKYMDARRDAGIKETEEDSQSNFIKYMVEDVDLGF
jgi:hypothetical protein